MFQNVIVCINDLICTAIETKCPKLIRRAELISVVRYKWLQVWQIAGIANAKGYQ